MIRSAPLRSLFASRRLFARRAARLAGRPAGRGLCDGLKVLLSVGGWEAEGFSDGPCPSHRVPPLPKASPYAAPGGRYADASIKQHLAAGIPPDKLVLGVAFYGRGFAGVKPEHHGLNQPYERFEAAHPYAELVEKFIGRDGFVREWDAQAQAPLLWNAQTRAFITYDDPQSIAIKADYVRKHRLGGMIFWELSQDSRGALLDAVVTGLKTERLSPRRQGRQGSENQNF